MNKVLVTERYLENIGKAIRAKTNSPTTYTPKQMAGAIGTLPQLVIPLEEKQVNFIDYDGTLLHAYTKAEINAMTSQSDLPQNPYHDGLIAQGWNWTLAQIKARLLAAPNFNITVGQMYDTENNDTKMYIDLNLIQTSTIYIDITYKYNITIDWGDNSTLQTYSENYGVWTNITLSHTYSSLNKYIISISSSNNAVFYLKDTNFTYGSNWNKYLQRCMYEIRCGNNMSFSRGVCNTKVLKRATLPSNLTGLSVDTFSGNKNLQSIIIPRNVTSIYDNALLNCIRLKYISIPANIQLVRSRAFENTAIKQLYLFASQIGSRAFYQCDELEHVILINCLSINDRAFEYCNALQDISLSNTLTTIGSSAFDSCNYLINITIPNSVTSIGTDAFSGCRSLNSLTLSNNLTEIRSQTFFGCYNLTNIIIPNSVTKIGQYAFRQCSKLTNLILSNNLLEIGPGAFFGCSSLTSITLPESLEHIGRSAFGGCNLTSCIIPQNVQQCFGDIFNDSVYSSNPSLTEVHCRPTTVPTSFSNSIFYNHPNLTLYVPSASLSAYRAAMGSSYESRVIGE